MMGTRVDALAAQLSQTLYSSGQNTIIPVEYGVFMRQVPIQRCPSAMQFTWIPGNSVVVTVEYGVVMGEIPVQGCGAVVRGVDRYRLRKEHCGDAQRSHRHNREGDEQVGCTFF